VCADTRQNTFAVRHYDLAMTLTSGQAFRWRKAGDSWTGVVGDRWVCLTATSDSITAITAEPVTTWDWLSHYLQLSVNLETVLATFPSDPPMQAAVAACRGLRLLRQSPWECLASFILSSTKQILQIQQIIALLCQRYGEPLSAGDSNEPAYSFPSPERIAALNDSELRACKMGFRAPFLLGAARQISEGKLELNSLYDVPLETARERLLTLTGVGHKIGDCVLLFAFGHPGAFPVDVWIMKALRQLYFPRRKKNLRQLHRFVASHFGPNAGYAQQYLFHYARSQMKRK
jgi:N-glycosylase/DNA lyase